MTLAGIILISFGLLFSAFLLTIAIMQLTGKIDRQKYIRQSERDFKARQIKKQRRKAEKQAKKQLREFCRIYNMPQPYRRIMYGF